jgi:hypothetical protein
VEGVGAAVNELLNELGEIGAGSPLSGEVANLLLGGNLTSEEEPEETLGKGLLTAGGLGEKLLALGNLNCLSCGSLICRLRFLRSCHGNGYPPQSRGRNPVCVVSNLNIFSPVSCRYRTSQTRDLMPRAPP